MAIEVSWQATNSTWLCSVIFSVRSIDTSFILRSKCHDKRLILAESIQLPSQFDPWTLISCYDSRVMTNDWFYLTLFNYFHSSIERHSIHTTIEVDWQAANSRWLSSVTFLVSIHRHSVYATIEVSREATNSIRLSSVIFSVWSKDTQLVLWSKSHDNWLIPDNSVQLISLFDPKTLSSYFDQSLMTNN